MWNIRKFIVFSLSGINFYKIYFNGNNVLCVSCARGGNNFLLRIIFHCEFVSGITVL